MSVRERVKQFLRMCGHALVSTVHERLNDVDRQLADILDQNTHLAQNHTALLQSGVHLVESLPLRQSEVEQAELRLASLVRDHCAAKTDLEVLTGQAEKIREELREFNLAIPGIMAANGQSLAGRMERLGQRLDDAARSTQVLHDEIGSIRQQIDGALSNLAVTNAHAMHEEMESMRQRLDTAVNNLAAMNAQAQEAGLAVLRPCLAGVLNLERDYAATRDSIASLEPVLRETRSFLTEESVRQVCVETSEYISTNPELGLMAFLYSHLPGRTAMDIGAHIGEVSNCLLKTGYEVYAFEPYPPSYEYLTNRLRDNSAFHAFNLALGAVDCELPLHLVTDSSNDRRYDDPTVFHSLARHGMPEGLSFRQTMLVPVKRVSDLHGSGIVPSDISLVKIDTEGYDLEVIRGMDGYRYPVVCVEFWDTEIPFAKNGLLYTVESIVGEMGRRNYFWYIVLYRVWGRNQTAFFCNHDRPVPGSWGNLFFFRDRETFQHAQQWCAAVLPRTYFKAVPASQATNQ